MITLRIVLPTDRSEDSDGTIRYSWRELSICYLTLCLSGVNNRKVAKLMALKTIAIS